MSEAEQRARAAGTSDEVIDTCRDPAFLRRCLQRAAKAGAFEHDMIQDVMDACDINELGALELGAQLLTVAEAADQVRDRLAS